MRRFVVLSIITGVGMLYGIYAKAQDITGHVVDEKNSPLAYVNLMLFNPKDTSYVQGAISRDDGSFSFNHEILHEQKTDRQPACKRHLTFLAAEDEHIWQQR